MLVAWLFVALHVQSASGCPVGPDVERQLGPLLGDEVAARDVATIAPLAGGSLSLSLADPTGQTIGARLLPPARTCEEQTKAVAVTLAVWEAQLHPEVSLALDRLEPEPAPALATPAIARVASAGSARTSLQWTLGLAATGDLQSGQWAPGGRLELGLGPRAARWRARLAVAGVGRHQTDLPPGTVSWRRGFVQLGAEVDAVAGARWAVVLGGGAVGGMAWISGGGFAADRTARSVDLGAEARTRMEARLGARGQIRPWVGAGVPVWVRRQSLDVVGGSGSASLPRVAVMGALGVDFVW